MESSQKDKMVMGASGQDAGGKPMETGDAGEGTSTGLPGPAGPAVPLMDRVREYLAKRKATLVSTASPPEGIKKNVYDPAGTYSAIKKFNEHSLLKPNLNGMAESKSPVAGSFYNEGDTRMNLAILRTNFEKKINLSLSFDPVTKLCSCCGGEKSHQIDGGVSNAPMVIILSDQSFPPYFQLSN